MRVALLVFASVLWVRLAAAEIYSWQDASGVRHFTNVREEIPERYREGAEVVVSAAWSPKMDAPVAACEDKEVRQAQVVVVPREPRRQRKGVSLALPPTLVQGGNVNIDGPLAVAVASPPVGWPAWAAAPLVTTAFDRGRSRHLTLRQLAEEQKWLQEAWGWSPGLPQLIPFAGGPRPPCVAWRTCQIR